MVVMQPLARAWVKPPPVQILVVITTRITFMKDFVFGVAIRTGRTNRFLAIRTAHDHVTIV